jgi:short-subunit dehydrogenase
VISQEKYGPWAVIAGGSEGIGACLARRLAAVGIHVVLIARKLEPLEELASEIRRDFGVQVRALSLDLMRPDILERVREQTDDIEVGLLIYNAGNSGGIKAFLDKTLDQVLSPVRLCVFAPTAFTHHFAGGMAKRGRGGVIYIGSFGAFAGVAKIGTYCGAKAYEQIFAEAMWSELQPHGIDVLMLTVNETDTPSRQRAGVVDYPGRVIDAPDDIARQALENITNGPVQVPPRLVERFKELMSPDRRRIAEMVGNSVQRKAGDQYR